METEIELLTLARNLNNEALIKVFDLCASPLYRYVLRLCKDPLMADEIVPNFWISSHRVKDQGLTCILISMKLYIIKLLMRCA